MVEPELISRADTAARLGVSVRTVDRLRVDGVLVTTHVCGRAMIAVASLERWLGKKCETGGEARPVARDWDGFELPVLDRELERRRTEREQRVVA